MNCIFRPDGKKAPPRPRRFAASSSSMTAANVRADVDQPPSHRLQMEHVVEGRDALHEGRRQVERICYLHEGLGWQPTLVLLLRQTKCGHDSRPGLGILLRYGPDLSLKMREHFQRSTSPMTVSSEPTIAIRSAM